MKTHVYISQILIVLTLAPFIHGTIAEESNEIYIRKNDNYKNPIAAMPDADRPPWVKGEPMVPG